MKGFKTFLILIIMVCLVAGCASTKHTLKAGDNSELVQAEGIAPIIDNNLRMAKEVSLKEAFKNALGLVVGIYVSQESLVSKSILIEDNILAQTEGYIEKYDVIKESYDDKFYKTKINAVVRKEDLLAKMKAMELNGDNEFKPIISVEIKEYIDNKKSKTKYAENKLKKMFMENGYKIHLEDYADILITGIINSNYDTNFNKIKSYQAVLSLKATNLYGQELSSEQVSVGGAGITNQAAFKTSCENAITKIYGNILKNIEAYIKNKAIVLLYVSGIENINELNSLINTLRTTIEIKDCLVRKYDTNTSLIELYLKYPSIDKLITRLKNIDNLKINQYDNKNITAEYISE